MLSRCSYASRRVEGVLFDAENNSHEECVKNGFDEYLLSASEDRRNGVAGCWIAHAGALKSIEDREGFSVILEDDFAFKADFFDIALDLISRLDGDFDVVCFDCIESDSCFSDEVFPGLFRTHGKSFPFYRGSHCLFVNNRRVPKILDAIGRSKVKDYDGFLFSTNKLDVWVASTGRSQVIYLGTDIDRMGGFMVKVRGVYRRMLYLLFEKITVE